MARIHEKNAHSDECLHQRLTAATEGGEITEGERKRWRTEGGREEGRRGERPGRHRRMSPSSKQEGQGGRRRSTEMGFTEPGSGIEMSRKPSPASARNQLCIHRAAILGERKRHWDLPACPAAGPTFSRPNSIRHWHEAEQRQSPFGSRPPASLAGFPPSSLGQPPVDSGLVLC